MSTEGHAKEQNDTHDAERGPKDVKLASAECQSLYDQHVFMSRGLPTLPSISLSN